MVVRWDEGFYNFIAGAKVLNAYGKGRSPLFTKQTLEELQDRTISLELVNLDPTYADTFDSSKFYYRFRNSPDDYSDSTSMRVTVTQTRGGYWVEDYGEGIREIQLRGNTGFRKLKVGQGSEVTDGKQLIKKLAHFIHMHNNERRYRNNKGSDFRKLVMVYHMFADDIHLVVQPTNFTINRSKNNPMMYMYSLNLTVLGDYRRFVLEEGGDSVAKMMHDSSKRVPKIKQNFELNLESIIDCFNKSEELVNAALTNPGKVIMGGLLSLGVYLAEAESELTSSVVDSITGKTEVHSYGSFGRTQLTLQYSSANNNPTTQIVTAGITKDSLAAVGIQDYEREQISAKVIEPNTNVWTFGRLLNFVTVDLPEYTETLVGYGVVAYDVIRAYRQMRACLASLLQYPELFKELYEDDVAQARQDLLDSGCATTLRL